MAVGDLTARRRVVVVTGGSSGIGLAAAVDLARRGCHLVLVGRDSDRLHAAVEAVRHAGYGRAPDAYRADFAALDEVRALGKKLREAYPRIDVLANNAGLIAHHRSITVDGFEVSIQVNHLAGFLLSHLLLDSLAGGRLITTASVAERMGALEPGDLNGLRQRYSKWTAYGSSKQANILFTAEAARRWADRGITPACYHPGTVSTRFGRGNRLYEVGLRLPVFRSPEQGADTLVWLADPDADPAPGRYYRQRKPRTPSRRARDERLAQRLWDASLRAVGLD